MRVTPLAASDIGRLAEIDRSEHVDGAYAAVDGRLVDAPVSVTEIPAWDPVGSGPHSVAAHIEFCAPLLAGGAVLLGAIAPVDDDRLAGVAVVDPAFEPGLAWLAFLHVSRPHRRQGAARALWIAAAEVARQAGATTLYVSATPTASAVDFYLAQGCRLADPPHPALLAHEPDDIHLLCSLR